MLLSLEYVLQAKKTLPDSRHRSSANALPKNTTVRKPSGTGLWLSLDVPAQARRLWLYPHPGLHSFDTPFPAPTQPGCCKCCPVPRHPYGLPQLKAAPSLGSKHGRRNKEQTLPPQVPSAMKHHFFLY